MLEKKRRIAILLGAALVAAGGLGVWHWRRPGAGEAGRAGSGPATDPAANVLLITLDTTRADHIGTYGYRKIETPALDALAREGVRFDQAISSIPLTLPAHCSILTGSLPIHHRVRDNGGFFLGKEQTTLAEVLGERGFATAAFVGAFVVNRHWGIDQGFATYDDEFGPEDPRAAADLHEQRDGAEVADHALRWWDENPGRHFFVWLHFYDPHYPYEPKGYFAAQYPERPYDGEIAYTDFQVGRVVEYLKKKGLLDSTLIVVVGDHGEGLDEHGEPDHGIFLYDATLRVPLIVRAPRGAYRGAVGSVVRDMDVMPTILDYLEIPAPTAVRGKSMLPLMAGRPEKDERYAYGETAYVRYHYGWKDLTSLRSARYKYIELPRPELYDLKNDPGETVNLVAERPETAEDLRGIIAEFRREAGTGAEVQQPEAMDPETLARLQSLGYLGATAKVSEDSLADPKDKREVLDVLIRASRETGAALKSRRFAEAAATVERAISLEPNFMDGYQFLGTLYLKLGRPDDAIAALKKILDVNPESIQARMALAKCHMAKRDYRTALGLAESVIAKTPTYVAAYYAAADALAEMGRYGEAIESMRRLGEARPDAKIAQYEIGRFLLREGKIDDARRQIQKALEIEPKIRSAHFNLALIAEQRGDKDLAVQEYEKEIALFPTNVEALTNLGILRMQRGEIPLGIETFERLVAADPDSPAGYYLFARASIQGGRLDERVVGAARKAAQLDPSNPRISALVREIESRRVSGSP